MAQRLQVVLGRLVLSWPLLLPSFWQGKAGPAPSPVQTQTQKPLPAGPPAPQSRHYPILLLGFGNQPNWSVRIGLKGPQRFDGEGYPPIPLEPAGVTHEPSGQAWTSHPKDSAAGALGAVRASREAGTAGPRHPF